MILYFGKTVARRAQFSQLQRIQNKYQTTFAMISSRAVIVCIFGWTIALETIGCIRIQKNLLLN